jgi:predicted nucleic acid-binding protein
MRVVLDTNVLVAAGFEPGSDSARIVQAARDGRVEVVWDEPTERESRRIVEKIPPLDWAEFTGIYRQQTKFVGERHPDRFEVIDDPTDRVFAALAKAAHATLVSNDDDVLSVRRELDLEVLTPSEFVRKKMD